MNKHLKCYCSALILILLFSFTSCSLFVPTDRFDGGQLLDSEEMSRIRSEIFASETTERSESTNISSEESKYVEVITDESIFSSETEDDIKTDLTEITKNTESIETERVPTEETFAETNSQQHPNVENSDTESIESESETRPSDQDQVYWTKSGSVWHLYKDCGHLKTSKNVISGSVEDAINEGKEKLCSTCNKRQNP